MSHFIRRCYDDDISPFLVRGSYSGGGGSGTAGYDSARAPLGAGPRWDPRALSAAHSPSEPELRPALVLRPAGGPFDADLTASSALTGDRGHAQTTH